MSDVRVRLTDTEWAAIRRVYEYDPDSPSLEVSAKRAGEKFAFSPPSKQAVWKRWKAECWERHGTMSGIGEAAQVKADRIERVDGTFEATDDETYAAEARIEAENKRAELLVRHRAEWKQVATLRQEAVNLRKEDMRGAQGKIRFAKTVADTTRIQQEGERRAHGLDDVISTEDIKRMTDEELRNVVYGRPSRARSRAGAEN